MSAIRVIAGSLKGRIIPFSNKKFGDADITPQKIKGALFSIFGDITGTSFLDLYSCSGQIGVEALSRGAGLVIMNESDPGRFRFIRDTAKDLQELDRVILLNMHASRALTLLRKKNISCTSIFADPPYPAGNHAGVYDAIIDEIDKSGILPVEGTLVIQHGNKTVIGGDVGSFSLIDRRVYGSNALSFYRLRSA